MKSIFGCVLLIDSIIHSSIEKRFDRRNEEKHACTPPFALFQIATTTTTTTLICLHSWYEQDWPWERCLCYSTSAFFCYNPISFTVSKGRSISSVSPSATALLGLYEYLGCFIDRQADRDLELLIGDYSDLTPDRCLLLCQQQRYPIAAIQSGNECYCGRTHGKHGQVPENECSYLCSSGEKCGGFLRNSIYRSIQSGDLSQGTGKYIGCFSHRARADRRSHALIDHLESTCQNTVIGYQGCFNDDVLTVTNGLVNSIDACVTRCARQGYNYAGIQNG